MGATSTPPITSSTSTKDERYDFEITYEMNTDRSSFFPFKFGYVTYPDVLRNVISQHEYQDIVELLSITGEPHNFIYRDLLLTFFLLLLLPSIITVGTTVFNPMLIYLSVIALVYVVFFFPFIALRIYKLMKKRNAIVAALGKRGVNLTLFVKFRRFNAIIGVFTLIQSLLWMNWAQFKFMYGSSKTIAQYSLAETFLYLFIVLDIVAIIYFAYNFMLFTKYRDIITNTTQSEHLTALTENIKKIEVVPFYLTYNVQTQPLLLSSSENDV